MIFAPRPMDSQVGRHAFVVSYCERSAEGSVDWNNILEAEVMANNEGGAKVNLQAQKDWSVVAFRARRAS